MDDVITTGFRKAHMRAFCYNIRDMNYIDKCALRNPTYMWV